LGQQNSQLYFPQLMQGYNDYAARLVLYQQNLQYLHMLNLSGLGNTAPNNRTINGEVEEKAVSMSETAAEGNCETKIAKVEESSKKCLNRKKQRPKILVEEESPESSTSGSGCQVRLGKRKATTTVADDYDEKVMLLGTKDEYEKFFKNEKTLLTENEMFMINQIDQPRKRKRKTEEPAAVTANPYTILEKQVSPKLREEIKAYLPLFDEELGKLAQEKGYQLMMQYFPEMYKNVNKFYIYIKAGNERKQQLKEKQFVVEKEKMVKPKDHLKSDLSNIRKVWESDKIEDKQLQDFLFGLEKQWPNNQYKFSQELILDLLKRNNYDFDKTRETVSKADLEFKTLCRKHYPFLEIKK